MVTRKEFDEVVALDVGKSMGITESFNEMAKYVLVKLEYNPNYDLYYKVSVTDVISSPMSKDKLLELHTKGGWQLSVDGIYLERFLNF